MSKDFQLEHLKEVERYFNHLRHIRKSDFRSKHKDHDEEIIKFLQYILHELPSTRSIQFYHHIKKLLPLEYHIHALQDFGKFIEDRHHKESLDSLEFHSRHDEDGKRYSDLHHHLELPTHEDDMMLHNDYHNDLNQHHNNMQESYPDEHGDTYNPHMFHNLHHQKIQIANSKMNDIEVDPGHKEEHVQDNEGYLHDDFQRTNEDGNGYTNRNVFTDEKFPNDHHDAEFNTRGMPGGFFKQEDYALGNNNEKMTNKIEYQETADTRNIKDKRIVDNVFDDSHLPENRIVHMSHDNEAYGDVGKILHIS